MWTGAKTDEYAFRQACSDIGESLIAADRKVVCIEDESEMIDLVSLILRRHRVQVIGALGGRQGLEKIESEKPDLVLLDLKMPVMNGWEVYNRMKASHQMKDIPVVILTAMTRNYDESLGFQDGYVDDYIIKPFRPRRLVESVNKALSSVPLRS
jgi:two-component system phosphate regulon response regulator PhoB